MQYQVAAKRSSGRPSRMPVTIIFCAATVPFSSGPAAMLIVSRAAASSPVDSTESSGRPSASARCRSVGP